MEGGKGEILELANVGWWTEITEGACDCIEQFGRGTAITAPSHKRTYVGIIIS